MCQLSIVVLLVTCVAVGVCRAEDPPTEALPDFDGWWNFQDPAQTRERFLELLPRAQAEGDAEYTAALLSQIARTHSLVREFDEAHRRLDEAAALPTAPRGVAAVRIALERGRAFNSAGDKAEARRWFARAYADAEHAGSERFAVDAVHMIAIAAEGEEALAWNELALTMAERASDERASKWRGPLYNNIGWTYHDMGKFEEALAYFRRDLAFREETGQVGPARWSRWSTARALRSLERAEEALDAQQALREDIAEHDVQDSDLVAFNDEELGECLWALDRRTEARPFLAEAYRGLSKLDWVESDRLESLKQRGQVGD